MIKIPPKKAEITTDLIFTTFWKSTVMALIFTIPALGVFVGLYYGTNNIILSAIVGFGIHFITLAFSSKISKCLVTVKSLSK